MVNILTPAQSVHLLLLVLLVLGLPILALVYACLRVVSSWKPAVENIHLLANSLFGPSEWHEKSGNAPFAMMTTGQMYRPLTSLESSQNTTRFSDQSRQIRGTLDGQEINLNLWRRGLAVIFLPIDPPFTFVARRKSWGLIFSIRNIFPRFTGIDSEIYGLTKDLILQSDVPDKAAGLLKQDRFRNMLNGLCAEPWFSDLVLIPASDRRTSIILSSGWAGKRETIRASAGCNIVVSMESTDREKFERIIPGWIKELMELAKLVPEIPIWKQPESGFSKIDRFERIIESELNGGTSGSNLP